jgi:hypothetical protein
VNIMTFSTGITLRSDMRAMEGIVQIAPVKSNIMQACWPEANVLISRRADPLPVAPGYTAEV